MRAQDVRKTSTRQENSQKRLAKSGKLPKITHKWCDRPENLFHLDPLRYGALVHEPRTVVWGHAICNTVLGQRKCHPLAVLQAEGMKIGIIAEDGIETFGWMSKDFEMTRSTAGDVWIRLVASVVEGIEEPA
jgi:hypothetical protein